MLLVNHRSFGIPLDMFKLVHFGSAPQPLCSPYQWQIQDFPERKLLFGLFFAENCMKMKEIGLWGGGGHARPGTPFGSANVWTEVFPKFSHKISSDLQKIQFSASGGSKGGGRPPTAQNFLDFMQFLGKFDKIVCWRPPPRGSAPPPTGNPGSAPECV